MIARSLLGVEQTVSGGVSSLSSSLPPSRTTMHGRARPAHDDFTFSGRGADPVSKQRFFHAKATNDWDNSPGGIPDKQWLERRRAVKLTGC